MNSLEAFELFIAVKLHFNQSSKYNFFVYDGKLGTIHHEKFRARNDKKLFEKLSKHKDPLGFVLSNVVAGKATWVHTVVSNQESETTYKKWLKIKQSLYYSFCEDLKRLKPKFDENFRSKNGTHPSIIKLHLQGKVSLETLTILANLTGVCSVWDVKMKDDPLWPEIRNVILKYEPFLEYDRQKFKSAILKQFSPIVQPPQIENEEHKCQVPLQP